MYGGDRVNPPAGDRRNALDSYQGVQKQLDGDIYMTNNEIKILNTKIYKNDYDHTQLNRLQHRHRQLMEKKRELQQTIINHQHMHQEMEHMKVNQHQNRHQLGREYLQLGDQKRRRQEDQRRRVLQQERSMHQHTRRGLQEDYIRKRQVMEEQKRTALQELAMREDKKRKQKEERERQKQQYNQKVLMRNQIETQKDSVYKQYYNQFTENQQTLQNIYKGKAAVVDRERQLHLSNIQKKQLDQFQQRVARDQEDRVNKIHQERDMLRSYLKEQMNEKEMKKSRDRDEERNYHAQIHRYQVNAAESEQMQRMHKKEEQRRYDEDLRIQTRSRMHSYNTPSEVKQAHNPITNPIDFKFGITNPYVIKQFQQAKERHLGESQALKVRNLAMVGNATLRHS